MNTWHLSWSGVKPVIALEIKQRIRSRKTFITLGIWFAFLALVTFMLRQMMYPSAYGYVYSNIEVGRGLFSFLTPFVLFMCLMITPAFASSSIVSDREQGVLAALQATRLTAAEIATGKLIASWLVAGVFVLVSAPFLLYTVIIGGISLWQVVVCLLVMLAEIGFVCAIGLGWSAMVARSVASAVLTYLSVFALTLVSLLLFLLSNVFVTEYTPTRTWGLTWQQTYAYGQQLATWTAAHPDGSGQAPAPPFDQCDWSATYDYGSIVHTEYTWWLLMINPFVIVADAAPLPAEARGDLEEYMNEGTDLQAVIKYWVRMARMGEQATTNDCGDGFYANGFRVSDNHDGTWKISRTTNLPGQAQTWNTSATTLPEGPVPRRTVDVNTPVWPLGLLSNLIIGGLFFRAAVVRLRVPYGTLAKGVRVA
jgi:ABC-type transport system involved in multi-copper enzyme maturation permease subunit